MPKLTEKSYLSRTDPNYRKASLLKISTATLNNRILVTSPQAYNGGRDVRKIAYNLPKGKTFMKSFPEKFSQFRSVIFESEKILLLCTLRLMNLPQEVMVNPTLLMCSFNTYNFDILYFTENNIS